MIKNDLIIVGGGITGLATAYIASKTGQKVTILEAAPKVGGLLSTFHVGGSHLEYYYHHFFTHDAEINWLIKELEIEDQLVYRKTRMGIFRNGRIYNFDGILDLFRFTPLTLIGKIRFGLSSFFLGKFAKWKKYENVPAVDWFYKYAGRNVTNSIWKPLLAIKFGPYADKIPLAWMIGRLRQRMNSRKGGDEQLGYLNGSLNTLLQALTKKLNDAGVSILTNHEVQELIVINNQVTGVIAGGKTIEAEKVVLTIPGKYISKLVQPHHAELSNQIGAVKYFGAVCTILETDRKLSDIYWLNIADEGYPFGGIIEHTNFIGPDNYNGKHLIYLSRYFALDEKIASYSIEEIKEMMLAPLVQVYRDFDPSWILDVHVFRSFAAATVCDLNFSQMVVDAKLPIANLFLANMMHIYPDERSVNNSIRLAAEVCKTMGYDSGIVPFGNSMSAQIGFEPS